MNLLSLWPLVIKVVYRSGLLVPFRCGQTYILWGAPYIYIDNKPRIYNECGGLYRTLGSACVDYCQLFAFSRVVQQQFITSVNLSSRHATTLVCTLTSSFFQEKKKKKFDDRHIHSFENAALASLFFFSSSTSFTLLNDHFHPSSSRLRRTLDLTLYALSFIFTFLHKRLNGSI